MTSTKHKKAYLIVTSVFVLSFLFIMSYQFNKQVSVQNQYSLRTNSTALSYQPLAPIKDLTDTGSSKKSFQATLQYIVKWGIAAAVLLSVFMTILGGMQYMTTDAFSGKEDGKDKIQAAIAGLLLALSAWLILYTVNPRILQPPESELLK